VKTVVVGAGAAGLWCALHAAEHGPVVVVAPDPTKGSSTALAQGGIAAAVEEGDAPAAHAADTLVAGAGLSDPEAVRVLTSEAPAAIEELERRGMVFDEGGAPTLEGGHSARRVLHAGGDATGWAILQALLRAVSAEPGIEWHHDRAREVLLDGGRAQGVRTQSGEEVEGSRVVVATGGATGIFPRRTGPERATGDGMALAWDAGAALADLEFVQFHPTALDVPGRPARLLTEALRGEGAVLIDTAGHRFMPEFDPRADLAPRDIVARAISAVRSSTGTTVFLDATGIHDVHERFPTATRSCAEVGLDIARDPIPVAPAAHYTMGGVLTDVWARTTVEGLFACGEVACTGVHGANRLASNSLLETLVFGRRAALAQDGPSDLRVHLLPGTEPQAPVEGLPLADVRSLADRWLGVIRNGPDLGRAVVALASARAAGEEEPAVERSATLVAWILAQAALRRQESRGGHYRTDFPQPRAEWRIRQVVGRSGWGRVGIG
jgi:L-aspartate oxidase